jgi:hypothetical protein
MRYPTYYLLVIYAIALDKIEKELDCLIGILNTGLNDMNNMEHVRIYHPAPSMNNNITYRKYSHHVRSIWNNMSQYVRHVDPYGAYRSNRSNRYIWTNMSNMSNKIKLDKDMFFYENIEHPAPICLKVTEEK